MKPELQKYYTAFNLFAEEAEPVQPTTDDADQLLETLDYAGITVLPSSEVEELRRAAQKGYHWPAPLPYPANEPAESCEQYYCMTERWAHPILLQWGDEENASQWVEWDGDCYAPTEHTVTGFWPHPCPALSAGAALPVGAEPEPLAREAVVGSNDVVNVESLIKKLENTRRIVLKSWFRDQEAAFNHITNTVGYCTEVLRAILSPAGLALAALPASGSSQADSGQWVSVNERLPEQQGTVLVCQQDEKEGTSRVCSAWFTPAWSYDAENGGGRAGTHPAKFHQTRGVTHWQPLPAAPVSAPSRIEDSQKGRDQVNTFCEKAGHICTDTMCDNNGCAERARPATEGISQKGGVEA